MPLRPLTPRQHEILSVIRSLVRKNDSKQQRLPTCVEIGDACGISAQAANQQMKAIEEKGYLKLARPPGWKGQRIDLLGIVMP